MKNFRLNPNRDLDIITPPPAETLEFSDAREAVAELQRLYDMATGFLREKFQEVLAGDTEFARYRAFYPSVEITTTSFAQIDTRLSFGHVSAPGTYSTTITRPDLFEDYLQTQLELLIENHKVSIRTGYSATPIPLHFAFGEGEHVDGAIGGNTRPLRDIFDAPDLVQTDDSIANGEFEPSPGAPSPLAPFTAPRIDYSLHRLAHYTGTSAEHFQNYVLFTNYQFYVDGFVEFARQELGRGETRYSELVGPGNKVYCRKGQAETEDADASLPPRMPQMPAFHLKADEGCGITLINIGIGPSNAKTATDHVAVLRPHAWLMLGHCAGLRNSQSLGDYVLAHGYLREDNVLDEDLPVWIPIPPLAEIQVALEEAVAEETGLSGYELKKVMRTGTVATIDNRNWELRDQSGPVMRLSQSRAIALDMESATIAANGFRFRVPYGTLLCVSDKPLHGELKLPGMATQFYTDQVNRHLQIGIRALEKLHSMPVERLHSRKLRAFDETAFQ